MPENHPFPHPQARPTGQQTHSPTQEPAQGPAQGPAGSCHGDLACVDVEALLGDAHERIRELTRRLENAQAEKRIAVNEAVDLRSHPLPQPAI